MNLEIISLLTEVSRRGGCTLMNIELHCFRKNIIERNNIGMSPESKRIYRNAQNISLGETLFSEYVQGPIIENRTSSKSSRTSSKVDLANLGL
jgi:hypothetical protein